MALAREFAVFDSWYSSFPAASTPNHLFAQTATSAGCTATGAPYQCTPGNLFPQKTIYESLMESNKTWAYFYNVSMHTVRTVRAVVSNVIVDDTLPPLLL
jgi:phospholipase C